MEGGLSDKHNQKKFNIFPAPPCSYTAEKFKEVYGAKMFSIDNQTCSIYIPLQSENSSLVPSKALIYFHGNGYDLWGAAFGMLYTMGEELNMNIFANEYPKYGIHKGKMPTPALIEQQALLLYKFVNQQLGFDHKDIVVVGRSLGSGPACYIAGNSDCQNLILIHPFCNLKMWVDQKKRPFEAGYFEEQFSNDSNIRKTKARLLIIHGKQDPVIDVQHSKTLQKVYKQMKREDGVFIYPENMSHSLFSLKNDIIKPMKLFMNSNSINQPGRELKQLLSPIQPLLIKE